MTIGTAGQAGGVPHGRAAALIERLTFFSDAVFAIAITLLVIEIRLPEMEHVTDRVLGDALLSLIPQFLGFVISFLVVGRLWLRHHRAFGLVARVDARTMSLNLLFLLVVAFIPFPTAVLSEHPGLRVAVCFYAGWLTIAGVFNVLLMRHVMGPSGLRAGDVTDGRAMRIVRGAWASVAIGAITFAGGAIMPVLGIVTLIASPVIIWLFERGRTDG